MKIGELARRAGVSVRALRYYEEQGLLTSTRTPGGQRVYVETDLQRVELLQSLYAVGIASSAITEILPCVDAPSAEHSDHAWARIREHREGIAHKIDELVEMRDALDHVLEQHRLRQQDVQVL